jgi:DNA-binding MarR family transcriptional regulator
MGNGSNGMMDEIAQNFYEMSRFISKKMGKGDSSLTSPQYFILYNLFISGKSTVSCLAEVLSLTSGATTTAVNRLVEAGFLNRNRDQDDRRVVWITLTKTGQEMMEEYHQCRSEIWREMFVEFSEAELVQFLTLLKKLKRD